MEPFKAATLRSAAFRDLVVLVALLAASVAVGQVPAHSSGTIQMPTGGTPGWMHHRHCPGNEDAGPGRPSKQEGMFTMRLRVPADSGLDVHWHPRDERVTILSGLVRVGFGEVLGRGERWPRSAPAAST